MICDVLTLQSFCKEDEEHDPSEEFEEYLACAVCGDNGKSQNRPAHTTVSLGELFDFLSIQ